MKNPNRQRVFFSAAAWPAVAVCLFSACLLIDGGDTPFDLRCENERVHISVFRRTPRLSWKSDVKMQRAYEIEIASSAELLLRNEPDLWDSGKVDSPVSVDIPYQGKALQSRQVCFWRVRVWEDGSATPSAWSRTSQWEMALLEQSDWKARWIRGAEFDPAQETPALKHWLELAGRSVDKDGKERTTGAERLRRKPPATWLKRDFSVVKPVKRARLYSTAAGYFEVFLDGDKIGGRIMNPGQTDYTQRILYDVDDIGSELSVGEHTLMIHLGDGFYGQDIAFNGVLGYGRPSALLQLEISYEDGSSAVVVTDSSWSCCPSRILKNSVYAGEFCDARLEPENSSIGWRSASVLEEPPTQRLEAQLAPPVKMHREVKPRQLYNPEPGVWVYDFGQNFTGVPTLTLHDKLPEGAALYLRYAEWADDRGRISQLSDGAFATAVHQVDCYVSGGRRSEKWTPAFTWHGFRYIELTGYPGKPDLEMITAHLVRSAVRRRGRFRCSDPHLNRIHETALWTYESNLISIPSDCPVRERCGWTGDAHATLTMSNYNYDMATLWEKYLGDFRTSKHISPSIVPGNRSSNSHPDWAVAQVLIVWEHYLNRGDLQVLEEHYPALVEFMEYYRSKKKEGIVAAGYGDWCDPVRTPGTPRVGGAGKPQWTDPYLTSTALLVYASDIMRDISALLGREEDAHKYGVWKTNNANAFHQNFYDSEKNSYGSQTADSMALCFNIVPEELRAKVAAALNENVLADWNGHASVGALGHRWLYPALSDAGYAETALGTFHAKGHPGFDYLFNELNGTSLWERKGAYDPKTMEAPDRSLSHPFQGGYDAWFYMGLGGIRPDPEQPGYKHIFLKPVFPAKLDEVEVELEAPYGVIESDWKR